MTCNRDSLIHWVTNTNDSWKKAKEEGLLDIISYFNLAHTLTAVLKTGLADRLRLKDHIHSVELFKDLEPVLCTHLMRYLQTHGIVTISNDVYSLSTRGQKLLSSPALAHLAFYTEAYGPVVSNMEHLLTGKLVYGKGIERNGLALGQHCATLFEEYHTESMLEALEDISCKKILDLGCGGGQFLIDICLKSVDISGIGLDISEPAILFAKKGASSNNLCNRLNFSVADAFDQNTWPESSYECDVLCAHGVLHEHFRDGQEAVINILNKFTELLKSGFKAFILGEPELRYDLDQSDADLHLVHIFTAQGFPKDRDFWLDIFKKTDLECKRIYSRPTEGPRFNFFVLALKSDT